MNKDITKRLSKSKFLVIKQCPKKFWFEQTYPKQKTQSPQMKRGSEIHDLLEHYEVIRFNNDCEVLCTKEYNLELNNFINKFLKKYNNIVPESVEGKVYSNSEDIVIKWDRIDYDGKSRIVWDYKTGNLYEGSEFEKKFKFELMVYAYIYMKETGNKVDYVGIYFIDHGIDRMIKVTDDSIKWIKNEIMELKFQLYEYQKNNCFPEKYSYLCNYCDYKEKCKTYLKKQ